MKKTQVEKWTIRDVAKQFYTVPNTIVRMCQKLGFKGYTQFKEELKKTLEAEETILNMTDLDEKVIKTKQLLNKEVLEEIISKIHDADNILFFRSWTFYSPSGGNLVSD